VYLGDGGKGARRRERRRAKSFIDNQEVTEEEGEEKQTDLLRGY